MHTYIRRLSAFVLALLLLCPVLAQAAPDSDDYIRVRALIAELINEEPFFEKTYTLEELEGTVGGDGKLIVTIDEARENVPACISLYCPVEDAKVNAAVWWDLDSALVTHTLFGEMASLWDMLAGDVPEGEFQIWFTYQTENGELKTDALKCREDAQMLTLQLTGKEPEPLLTPDPAPTPMPSPELTTAHTAPDSDDYARARTLISELTLLEPKSEYTHGQEDGLLLRPQEVPKADTHTYTRAIIKEASRQLSRYGYPYTLENAAGETIEGLGAMVVVISQEKREDSPVELILCCPAENGLVKAALWELDWRYDTWQECYDLLGEITALWDTLAGTAQEGELMIWYRPAGQGMGDIIVRRDDALRLAYQITGKEPMAVTTPVPTSEPTATPSSQLPTLPPLPKVQSDP